MDKKAIRIFSACLGASVLLTTSLIGGAGAQAGTAAAAEYPAHVEIHEADTGTLEVKDGALHITPKGGWGWIYTKNVNTTGFAAAEDVEITFDYQLEEYEWAPLFDICVGGGSDRRWGSVLLRIDGIGSRKSKLLCMTDWEDEIKSAENVELNVGETYRFHIRVDKTAGTLSAWVTELGKTETAQPQLTVTDEEYKKSCTDCTKSDHNHSNPPESMVSTLSGGLRFGAQFYASTVQNLKITAGDKTLVEDFMPSTSARVEICDATSNAGTVEVKDGALVMTPDGGAELYTKNVNATDFTAAEDVEITFDYTPEYTWAPLFSAGVGGGSDRQWGSVRLYVEGDAGKIVLKALNDWGDTIVSVDDAMSSGETYRFRIKVDKAAKTLSAWVTKSGETEADQPLVTVTDETYKKSYVDNGRGNPPESMISTLSGGLNFRASYKTATVSSLKITTNVRTLVEDFMPPAPPESSDSSVESSDSSTESGDSSTESSDSSTESGDSSTESGDSSNESEPEPSLPEEKSTVTLDFDGSLKVAHVALDKSSKAEDGNVKMENGKLHLTCGTRNNIWSDVINANLFTASQDVEISFDYESPKRDWAADTICIGAKGDKQWGGFVLALPNTAEGTKMVELQDEMLQRLADGGNLPLFEETLYHFRITLTKSTGTLKVWITESGKKEAKDPVLSYTNDKFKTLSGGVAFGGWSSDYTVDNLKITAGDKVLINADFSTEATDAGHKDNQGSGTAFISGGALHVNGWNPEHTGGSDAITKGMLGVSDMTSFDLSLEYTPTDVTWSRDKILLGYGDNGTENGTLMLEMFGEGRKVSLKKKVDGQETVLAEADMTYTANTTYEIRVSVNAPAGKAAVSIAPVGGTAVELNVKDEFIKTLKGDIGFSSWGGNYMVDNMTVTAYGIVLPGSEASNPGDSGDGSHGNVDTGVALPMLAMILLFSAAAVLLLLNWKGKRVHNG